MISVFDILVDFAKKHKLMLLIFLLATTFFIYQRFSGGVHWDFALYVSNARYMFSSGLYFDWWVPPMAPFLLGLFSIFGWSLAEYVYIVFVSLLFLFSCTRFSKTFGVDSTFFYAAFINSYVLMYGLRNGTELLSLSFLMLFFAYFHDKKRQNKSAVFLALSFLSRYSNLFFLPFVLLSRNLRKIVTSMIVFAATLSPWLIYNYIKTGNPLTSIGDYYVLVKLQSLYYSEPNLQYISLALAASFLLSLLLLRKRLRKLMDIKSFSMLLLLLIVVISFLNMPFRNERYLFFATLPVIYFFVRLFQKYKKILYIVLAFNLLAVSSIIPIYIYNEDSQFVIKRADNCTLMSNAWVYHNYHGIPSEPYPFIEFVNESINQGYRIVLFKWVKEPEYSGNETFHSQFPIIENNSVYIILGNESLCKENYEMSNTFKERKDTYLREVENTTIQEELGCENGLISKALCYTFGI